MLIRVKIFWTEDGTTREQSDNLPQVPVMGDLVRTNTGYENSVASRRWLLDGPAIVHIVLN
jgi:hypothetical protein